MSSQNFLTVQTQLHKQLVIVDTLNRQLLKHFQPLTTDFKSSVEVQLTKDSVANLLYNAEVHGNQLSKKINADEITRLIHRPIFDQLNIDISINVFDSKDNIDDEDQYFYDDYLDMGFSEDDDIFADVCFESVCDPCIGEITYSYFIPLTGYKSSDTQLDTYTRYPTQEEYDFAKDIAKFINKQFGLDLMPAKIKTINEKDLNTVHDVLADKDCQAQLSNLTIPAYSFDETVYLNIAKRKVSIEFLFDGYNFYWNSCNSKPFKKYDLPINYSLYDRSWRFNEIEPSGYCKRELKETDYNPYENFRSYFAPALDNNYIYGYFEPAIVLNKGKIAKIQKKDDHIYFINDKGNVIVTVENAEVTNPRLLMKLINDLLIKIGI